MVRIRRITQADPLYAQECALREEVLLGPIGYTMARFRHEFVGVEERLEHFVAVVRQPAGEQVIGCAALLPHDPVAGCGRLMQMAVNPQRQGEGIGRQLVVAVESRALGELGLCELYSHAPVRKVGFLQALGWVVEGEIFQEAGLPHRLVRLRPPAPQPLAGEDDPPAPESDEPDLPATDYIGEPSPG